MILSFSYHAIQSNLLYKRFGFWSFEDEGYEKIENGLFSSKCLRNPVFCKVQ